MKKSDIVHAILRRAITEDNAATPVREKGLAFAPTNIALCKYWGKRDTELNLPTTSSLSIALPDKGAMTTVTVNDYPVDQIILNDEALAADSSFVQRVSTYLDLFRGDEPWHLDITIKMNIPVAAGLASSACGFASLVMALNDLFDWRLSQRNLSILARLGSGSASRSIWTGFVEWDAGARPDGMDSYGAPLEAEWPSLCVGVLTVSNKEKSVSSRDAMQQTLNSSMLYASWVKKSTHDLAMIKQAIKSKNFSLLGGTAESNALGMHASMLSSWPPICYFLPETIAAMQTIWDLRKAGLEVYFTQDAGPNLKLLFLDKNKADVLTQFTELEVVKVFE